MTFAEFEREKKRMADYHEHEKRDGWKKLLEDFIVGLAHTIITSLLLLGLFGGFIFFIKWLRGL
jgi:hypothetical protein